jgi:hypothetical protein
MAVQRTARTPPLAACPLAADGTHAHRKPDHHPHGYVLRVSAPLRNGDGGRADGVGRQRQVARLPAPCCLPPPLSSDRPIVK